MVSEPFRNSRSLILWPIFSHYFCNKIKFNHSYFCHFFPHLSKKKKTLKSSLCSWPPRSRSGVYYHQITNQIPLFCRSNAAFSNTAKIDPIQRWTLRHTPVEFSAVRSRAAPLDPHSSRALYHTPYHVSPTHISDPRFDPWFTWPDPLPCIFYFFFSKFKKKIQNKKNKNRN